MDLMVVRVIIRHKVLLVEMPLLLVAEAVVLVVLEHNQPLLYLMAGLAELDAHQVLQGRLLYMQVAVAVVAVIKRLEVYKHLEVQELVELASGVVLEQM
jgi:hypothetical protein